MGGQMRTAGAASVDHAQSKAEPALALRSEKDGENIVDDACGHGAGKLGVLPEGERFSFRGFHWVILDHLADGGVLAIMDGCWKKIPFDASKAHTDNYAQSTLRSTLLKELLPALGEETLLPHVVDLVADDGDDRYGTVTDKVFILSCDEYRKYRKLVPLLDDGSWTCTPWCIDTNSGNKVRYVMTNDSLHVFDSCYCMGVIPACVFNPKRISRGTVMVNGG